jgi:thiol-disulfide isomerase/thioredoxin
MIRKSLSLTSLALAAVFAVACSPDAPKPSETKPADTKPADTPAAEVRDGTTPGDRLPSFAAKTFQVVDGKTVEADYDHAKTQGVRVYVVNSTTCPYTKKYAERMTQVEATYAAKGVTFVYAYPNGAETADAKQAWHTSKGHKGPWIVDKGGAVTKHLNGGRTPEYVVVNADGIITYRGGIDDSMGKWQDAKAQYLTDALDATLAGKPVATPETTAAG